MKLSSLGDIVQTVPALLHVRKALPNIFITWIVDSSYLGLVKELQVADEVKGISFSDWKKGKISLRTLIKELFLLRKEAIDVSCDFQGNLKSFITHMFISSRKRVGYAMQAAPELFGTLFLTKRVVPDATSVYKRYLSLVSFALDIDMPSEIPTLHGTRGEKVYVAPFSRWDAKVVRKSFWESIGTSFEVLAGKDDDTDPFADHVIHADLSWKDLIEKVRSAKHVYGVDSFVVHLAAVLGVPTSTVFGASSAAYYTPPGGTSMQGECPLGVRFDTRCPHLRRCKSKGCVKKLTSSTRSFFF